MPTGRGSHRWCSVCHARWIDKSKHKNMCKVCYQRWDQRRRDERAAIKLRRAARLAATQNGVVSMSDPTPEPVLNGQVKKHAGGRPPRRVLTEEEEQEIIRLYQTTTEPVSEIARAFGVHPTYPYAILERRQIPRTRQDSQAQGKPKPKPKPKTPLGPLPIPTTATEARAQAVPEPVHKALENMLKLPPKPEPVAQPVRSSPSIKVFAETERWAILVEGWIEIDAAGLEQVIVEIRARYPGLTVTQLRREP